MSAGARPARRALVGGGMLPLAFVLWAALPPSVGAQEVLVPACTAATTGQLGSQAGVRCACRHFPASALAGTPAGHRWDCGILRARFNDAPVDLNPYPYPLTGALWIDRRPRR
jgi:hypothetical protein